MKHQLSIKLSIIELLPVLIVIVALLGTPFMIFIQAKCESEAYNRLTGAHTTWWDALWLELRVQDAPK